MKISKKKEPKVKDLNHISTEWYEEKDMLTRISVYNKKEVVPKGPKGDGPLTNEQFNKLMSRFDGLETKVDGLETKVDNLETKVDNLETKVDANTSAIKSVKEDVKALDDRIQNLVDKNDLKE